MHTGMTLFFRKSNTCALRDHTIMRVVIYTNVILTGPQNNNCTKSCLRGFSEPASPTDIKSGIMASSSSSVSGGSLQFLKSRH